MPGYNHRPANEKVVGQGPRPATPVPTNLLVRPLQSPPMERVKDAEDEHGGIAPELDDDWPYDDDPPDPL